MSAVRHLKSITPLVVRKDFQCDSTGVIFRLHCKATTAILIAFSVLLSIKEYFGNPIDCITDLPKKAVNSYCWISSTFTMPDYYFRHAGMAPGIGSPKAYDDREAQSNWRFHNYYQWVVLFLFLMGGLCYLPSFIWKKMEGGRLKQLYQKAPKGMCSREDIKDKNKIIIDYLLTHLKLMESYWVTYIFCEMLCLINIILQMVLLNVFFDTAFIHFGTKVLEFSDMDQRDRVDPMIYLFPRLTKCHFHLFGPSGTIQRSDSLCLLPQNIMNEKIFIFVWFWYIILIVLLSCLMLYRLAIYLFAPLRLRLTASRCWMVPRDKLSFVINEVYFGDWWMLNLLAGVMESVAFRDVINQMFEAIKTKENNHRSYEPVPTASAPYYTSSV